MEEKVKYWKGKAYYTQLTSNVAPLSHSLSYLARKGGFFEELSDEQKSFLDQIEPLNIEARYPSHKEKLLKSLDLKKCEAILIDRNNDKAGFLEEIKRTGIEIH